MRYHPFTKTVALLSATFLLHGVEARKWQDVVDPKIYLQSDLDSSRYQLKIEMDPFFIPDLEKEVLEPTAKPASSAWVKTTPSPTNTPTMSPTMTPTTSPTGPTSSPTLRSGNVQGNGGCPDGTVLYRVNMYDSWGDGWSDATLMVITGFKDQDTTTVTGSTVTKTHVTKQGNTTVSMTQTVELTSDHPFGTADADADYKYVSPLGQLLEGTLHQGSEGYIWVCLVARRCYEVIVSGGDYLDEVSWSIDPVFGTITAPIVEGRAPQQCNFSIPDADGQTFCDAECGTKLSGDQTIVPAAVTDHLTVTTGNSDIRFEFSTEETTETTTSESKSTGDEVVDAIEDDDS